MRIQLPYEDEFDAAQTGHVALPFGDASSLPTGAVFTSFGFTGNPTSGGEFFPGWKLVTPAGSGLENLRAMFIGSLWVEKIDDDAPYYRLLLVVNDPTLFLAWKHLEPDWFPAPGIVVYENVALESVRTALKALGDEEASADDAAATLDCMAYLSSEYGQDFASWEDAVDTYLEDIDASLRSPFPVIVTAGMTIATAAASPDDASALEARVYVRRLVDDLDAFAVDPDGLLYNPSYYVDAWPALFAEHASHPLFTDLATADWGPVTNQVFRFVSSTGGVTGEAFTDPARPSSTITAAIAAADPHDTVVILDTATYSEAEILIDKPLTLTSLSTADPITAAQSAFPKLSGSSSHRVIQVRFSGAAPSGLACIREVAIIDGKHQEVETTEDGSLGGGGVMVFENDQTLIDRCYFKNNKTSFASWTSLDLINAIETGITSTVKSAALVSALVDDSNEAALRNLSNGGLNAHGYGGACSLIGSSAYVRGCYFYRNIACGRGGGVSFAGYGWPVVEGCSFIENESSGATEAAPCDGGAIGATVCIPLPSAQGYNFRLIHMVEEIVAFVNAESLLSLSDPYGLAKNFFESHKANWYDASSLAAARSRFAVLRNNIISDNTASDDGGGIYLSVMSRCMLSGNTISGNTARGAAGGLRASMGSSIRLDGDTIGPGNVSNSGLLAEDDAGNGGGGIAARNVDCTLERVTVRDNTAQGWAGGGIFFGASDEGSIPGVGPMRMYHAILLQIFGFTACDFSIDGASRITGNTTTHLAGQSDHGKGAGVYTLRYEIVDVTTLVMSVDALSTVISGNTASFTNADELYLHDQRTDTIIDDTNAASYTSGGTFTYQSLT